MLVVQLLLFAMLVVGGLSLQFPSPPIAAGMAVLSAAWLPVNNGHLEGPVLLTVAQDHGLTVADLFAYLGLALALLAAWRWRHERIRAGGRNGWALGRPAAAGFVLFVVALLACGLTASWFDHTATATHLREVIHRQG